MVQQELKNIILAETITIFLSHETAGKKIKDSYWVSTPRRGERYYIRV